VQEGAADSSFALAPFQAGSRDLTARLRPFVALLCVCLGPVAAARAEEVKIEVLHGKREARLIASGASFTEGPEARPLAQQGGEGRALHRLLAGAGGLFLDGRAVLLPLTVHAGAEALVLDGRQLPGRVEVWAEKGALVVVNTLDLEDYVAAVVASEVPSTWPRAALEAQAVAARTYAVAQKVAQGPAARAHLGASVLDQVYGGAAHPASGARLAARSTAGEVLTWGAAPIAAYFSSSCGGRSESGEAAFNLPVHSAPYLAVADDGDADAGAPRRVWTVRLPLAKLSELLRPGGRPESPDGAKKPAPQLKSIAVASRTSSGRARTVTLFTAKGQRPLAAVELRQLVGYNELPSLFFSVEVRLGVAIFSGRGSGHGVGLCQWGARGRARRGEGYREILAHYYPGAEIRKMY